MEDGGCCPQRTTRSGSRCQRRVKAHNAVRKSQSASLIYRVHSRPTATSGANTLTAYTKRFCAGDGATASSLCVAPCQMATTRWIAPNNVRAILNIVRPCFMEIMLVQKAARQQGRRSPRVHGENCAQLLGIGEAH